jgi:hypothetical protein
MIIGRFLMRFLLVPLGGCVAIAVAMVFVMFAHWNRMAAPNADDYGGLATIFVMSPMLAVASGVMLWPATLGAMIAEVFAIRSWMYHAANGGLAAAVSLVSIGGFDKTYDLSDEPLIAVGAGIVAGFAYWLTAGWSAGFWKPVFVAPRPAEPPPVTPVISPPLITHVAAAPADKSEKEIAGQNPTIRDSTVRTDK